jgi:hypothetical protein
MYDCRRVPLLIKLESFELEYLPFSFNLFPFHYHQKKKDFLHFSPSFIFLGTPLCTKSAYYNHRLQTFNGSEYNIQTFSYLNTTSKAILYNPPLFASNIPSLLYKVLQKLLNETSLRGFNYRFFLHYFFVKVGSLLYL